jgi:hypothetical protein
MNFLHIRGETLIQQYEGGRQIAYALAHAVRTLAHRARRLLGTALSQLPGEHQVR